MQKVLIFILALLFTVTASAARVFPQNAKAGELAAIAYPEAKIDNTVYRLGPGALVFDQFNRMVLPNYVTQKAKVVYQLDQRGELAKIWLLTAEEIATLKLPKE